MTILQMLTKYNYNIIFMTHPLYTTRSTGNTTSALTPIKHLLLLFYI